MKKLKELSLKQLEEEMSVMDKKLLKSTMGGTDPNDCLWRCFAYIHGSGTNYSASDAEAMAAQYYGSGFDSNNYGFVGTETQAKALATSVLGSDYVQNSRQILVFNPNDFPDWQVNGTSHAVIVLGYRDGWWDVYDPQNNMRGSLLSTVLNQSSDVYFM